MAILSRYMPNLAGDVDQDAGDTSPLPGAPDRTHTKYADVQVLPLAIAATLPFAGGYLLSYLFRNINSVIASGIMRDLGIGAAGLGLLTSVYFLIFAAAQLPVGLLLDQFGPRRVQCGLLSCAATGAGLCAFKGGFLILLFGRALIGLGTAGGLIAGLKATAQWFPHERLALVNGIFVMCGGIGALAATWPAEMLLNIVNWREMFAVLAIAAGSLALSLFFSIGKLVPERTQVSAPKDNQPRLRDVFRDPTFRRFAPLSASCFGAILAWQGLWAGPWLADVDRLSPPEVARDLACMALVLIVAAPCWGMLTQRLRLCMKLTNAAACTVLVVMGVELTIFSHTRLPSILPWCLFASFGGVTVLSYSVLADLFPAEVLGRANGALNVLHIGFAFLIQFGTGQVIALWAPLAGRYPLQAYRAGLLLPMVLQAAALVWFLWPHSSSLRHADVEARAVR